MKYLRERKGQMGSNEALAKDLPLMFLPVPVTLLFLFRTYHRPMVILLILPLIFTGIVSELVLLGKSFDLFSILSLLGLIGMSIKNTVVLVEQTDLEAKTGKKPLGAVVSATTGYTIPVAMASGITTLDMLSLSSNAVFSDVATMVVGGLLVASALTSFVPPVAYRIVQRIRG